MSGQMSYLDALLKLQTVASFVYLHYFQLRQRTSNCFRRRVLLPSYQNTEDPRIPKPNMACSSYQMVKFGNQKRPLIYKFASSSSLAQAQVDIVANMLKSLRFQACCTEKQLKEVRNYSLPAAFINFPAPVLKNSITILIGCVRHKNEQRTPI